MLAASEWVGARKMSAAKKDWGEGMAITSARPSSQSSSKGRCQVKGKFQKGQSLVEFAIMLPLMVLLLVGIIQFGIILAHYLALNHAAVVGARTASVAPASTADADGEEAATKAAQSFIKNMSGFTPDVSNT